MATFYMNSNNQRDANPMIYLPGAYADAPVLPPNLLMHNSFCDSISANSQPHEIPSLERLYANQQHHEILSNLGGNVFRDEMLMMNSINGQGLSLSLGTQIPSAIQIPSIPYRNMNPRDEQPRNSDYPDVSKGEMGSYGLHRSIPNSKYLKAAQQLLDEVVNVRKAMKVSRGKEEHPAKENEKDFSNPNSSGTSQIELSSTEKQDLQNKLTKLLSMLDEVDRRYKQYEHQMQIVVSSFDAIAGSGSAKPYTALALQTISRHFRSLRDAIISQINASRKALGDQEGSENGKMGIPRLRFVDQQLKQQRALQQMGMMQQNAWRPQRGLPETSVSILRAWLFEHFLHPYPKDSDKIMLARQTGLTRSQVSNWFINARVRLWKPMIEEMYKEEKGEAEMDSNSSSENAAKGDDTQISANSEAENVGEMTGMPLGNYGSFVNETGGAFKVGDGSRSVSLTLGLQHCEGGTSHGLVTRGGDVYGGSEASGSEFQRVNAVKRQQSRFAASHLLRDFVA